MFKLVKLYSNKNTFKTINFNDGVNIVVGVRYSSSDFGDTVNGVGKSLILKLISFCLGSNSVTAFSSMLSDWDFSLEYKINNATFIVRREVAQQKNIYLNDTKLTLEQYRNKMQELLCGVSDLLLEKY